MEEQGWRARWRPSMMDSRSVQGKRGETSQLNKVVVARMYVERGQPAGGSQGRRLQPLLCQQCSRAKALQ